MTTWVSAVRTHSSDVKSERKKKRKEAEPTQKPPPVIYSKDPAHGASPLLAACLLTHSSLLPPALFLSFCSLPLPICSELNSGPWLWAIPTAIRLFETISPWFFWHSDSLHSSDQTWTHGAFHVHSNLCSTCFHLLSTEITLWPTWIYSYHNKDITCKLWGEKNRGQFKL